MYSFDLTYEQRMQVDSVNRYAVRTLRQAFRQAEEEREIPAKVINTGWDLGLVPSAIPENGGDLVNTQPSMARYTRRNWAMVIWLQLLTCSLPT